MSTDSKTVRLPNGSRIPLVGLGMWQMDDPESVSKALEAAIDAGYRLIDTAFAYQNERYIGESLQKIFDSGKIQREELFIVSKLPLNGLSPDSVEYFFSSSLKDLQLEYMDLYLIHFPVGTKRTDDDTELFPVKDNEILLEDVDINETWKVLESFVDKGLVKSIGLSNFNSEQVQRIYNGARIKPANLQVECHAYLQQKELFEFCKKLDITLTAYAPLGTPGLPEFIRQNYHIEIKLEKLLEDEKLETLCSKYNKTPAQILLRFLVQRGITVIPKSSHPERIQENFQLFDFCLEEDDVQMLKSMDRNLRYFKFNSHQGMVDHPEYPFKIPF